MRLQKARAVLAKVSRLLKSQTKPMIDFNESCKQTNKKMNSTISGLLSMAIWAY
jgi:hypothetical protein